MAFPNFEIKRGLTFLPVEITLTEDNDTPMNLSGFSVFADVCVSPAALASFSFNPTITSAASGIITLGEITPGETMSLQAGDYTWDLVLENSSGQRLGPYVEGIVVVSSINTKP